MPIHELRAGGASALVSTTAGMLLDARFARGGTVVAPFARAPWDPDPEQGRPAHLDVLGGEFAAVPFGSAGLPDGMADGWAPSGGAAPPVLPHGYGANAEWTVLEAGASEIRLACDFPPDDDVRRLERRVSLSADRPRIEFELTVIARRRCSVPVGLHPILRLPAAPFSLIIDASFTEGHTYPGVVPPGAGAALPGRRFRSLAAVPSGSGPVDLARLPLDRPVEDVLLLTGVTAPIGVRFGDDGSRAVLDWDRAVLPSVLLWLSDRALGGDPWEHRYRGLGIEPVAAAFDLPPAVSAGPNPLAAAGVPTAVPLDPERHLVVRSSVTIDFPRP